MAIDLSKAAVLLLALFLAAAPVAVALPREKDRWVQVETENFTLFSQASAATAKLVGEDLEEFRAVLAQLTTGKLNAPIPTQIYVFGGDRAFNPYKRASAAWGRLAPSSITPRPASARACWGSFSSTAWKYSAAFGRGSD